MTKPEPHCPFYGFHLDWLRGFMLRQGGNRCALLVNQHSPCFYDRDPQGPDWDRCMMFNRGEYRQALVELANRTKVYPDRKDLPDELSLASWEQVVLGRGNGRGK